MGEAKLALVADIGGTNVRFGLVPEGETRPQQEHNLRCADFSGPVEAARHYLDLVGNPVISAAAFDVATAVTDDMIRLTNSPWAFSVLETRDALELERLHVINDFTALALSLPFLEETEKRRIGGGAPVKGSAIAVLGPGTGLGVSGLLHEGGRWVAVQGEGGHVAFSPMTEREEQILGVLRSDYGTHVSNERLLSGMGLTNIFRALCVLDGAEPKTLEPAHITSATLDGSDARCRETVDIFCGALGTAAANLTLTLGARGGVFIGGGIVPKLGDYFDRSTFRQRFEDKGRYRAYLAGVPTHVIVAGNPALRGLATLLLYSK